MNYFETLNNKEIRKRRDRKTGRYLPVHGKKRTKLYGVWCAMKERCTNPANKSYRNYGGRGVRVCDAWAVSFPSFEKWANDSGYKEGLTIDRIDSNKGYSPSNCRWATTSEQNRNYRRNVMITYQGETLCLSDMANKHGVNRTTVAYRLKAGKTVEEALSKIDGRTTRWKQ